MKYENWSRPRIYIVLHAIGELECMKFFVDHGVTDLWFPFTTESLPHGLRPAAHAKFGNAQKIVIPGTFNLESGQHCHLSKDDLDEEMFPRQLEWKATLGSGGFGFVYKVLRRGSSKEYALKQIRRKSGFAETLEVMQYVESELAVLRKLRGRHFVKLLGSYTSPNYVGLIMIPVADDNLASFLSKTLGSIDKKYLLWSFFGCLANALAYLHFTLKIRHKDIKPQNILVKGNNILLTDFGTALDWGDIGQTTTHQELRRSSLYCAPEVGKDELRRSSSDIWSLGCVYLEMITVLRGKTLEEMRSFFDDKGSGMRPFWENQEAIPLWIEVLRDRGSKFENEPLRWIDIMLQQNESDRPDARKLRDLILDSRPDYSGMTFCGACCQNTDPEWSTSHAMQGNLPLAVSISTELCKL
jgi:serine/threonine protein kinase